MCRWMVEAGLSTIETWTGCVCSVLVLNISTQTCFFVQKQTSCFKGIYKFKMDKLDCMVFAEDSTRSPSAREFQVHVWVYLLREGLFFCLVSKPVTTFFRHPSPSQSFFLCISSPHLFLFLLFLASRCLTYFLRLLQCSFLFLYRENPRTHWHTCSFSIMHLTPTQTGRISRLDTKMWHQFFLILVLFFSYLKIEKLHCHYVSKTKF